MLRKQADWFWQTVMRAFTTALLLSAMGCSNGGPGMNTDVIENGSKISAQESPEEAEQIADICYDLYDKAAKDNKQADLDVIRGIVNRFGENGYAAVDSKNQINMTEAEQVVRFCNRVAAKEEARLTIIEVTYLGGFCIYDLTTKDGKVDVVKNHYEYKDGNMKRVITGSYPAEYWNYTEDGYLMFSGTWFTDELYVLTLSEAEEHTGFRVQPLDETYRELNRKYLLPISYERNNMFLIDWSEDDFGELNFYDMYDILYSKVNARSIPYAADDNLEVGAVFRIPEDEFEDVIMTYFNIDSATLRSKTTYHSEDATYEYKPRGFYETEYPEYPYSEVVGFTENDNGTITLMAHAVFPYRGTSKVYAHEVVVRPLADGGVQYVSNRIIISEDNGEETWHVPRLTEQEWEERYTGRKDDKTQEAIPYEMVNKTNTEEKAKRTENSYQLPVDEREREEAENDCRRVMELISGIYKNADKGTTLNVVLSDETLRKMQNKIKESGYPVTTMVPYSNMENYEYADNFLEECMKGKSGSAVVYEVHNDGGIGRIKFIFDGMNMYVLNARTVWNERNGIEMSYISHTGIKEWKYTDKGWFCYNLCVPEPPEVTEIMDGSCLLRIKPMTGEEKELSESCVKELGYQGNNLLRSNWDQEHLEELDYNGIYEYLYRMKHQEKFPSENYPDGIPKVEFESLIMEYLPVTAEQLQEYAVFDEENQTYAWVQLGCYNYSPAFFDTSLPEVTDIKENKDGTVTLTVDAVCDMVLCDDAVITHELLVRFAEDGSFQYLGNKILKDGAAKIPDYQYRINIKEGNWR